MCDEDLDFYKSDPYYDGAPEKKAKSWKDLPDAVQEDLRMWFNSADLTKHDKVILFRLYKSGQFRAWDCPGCGDRVYEGNPRNYDEFQGVLNQDFSFFGDYNKHTQKYITACCDSCRLYGV